ncbi:hypothetical protein HZB02_06910 [Candidatus Woesearchaeota archaeon]|nr:hypothetical protein [Candidatus Woesearchaeota archaeon]
MDFEVTTQMHRFVSYVSGFFTERLSPENIISFSYSPRIMESIASSDLDAKLEVESGVMGIATPKTLNDYRSHLRLCQTNFIGGTLVEYSSWMVSGSPSKGEANRSVITYAAFTPESIGVATSGKAQLQFNLLEIAKFSGGNLGDSGSGKDIRFSELKHGLYYVKMNVNPISSCYALAARGVSIPDARTMVNLGL